MQRLFWTRSPVGQALSLTGLVLPTNDATMIDRQEHTAVSYRNALLLGALNHCEDIQFGLLFDPLFGYRSHEPPFVFFRRIASSTD